ncbi:glycoside hydrolase family 5 protein [Starkeya koreensis]|uniref:Glycoside hydrolase family 5 protein n=1 Tax=Ancylobacter koreensis TaxID=266121 RepID=A0ABT0DK72_9HYPH|nr:cellulase family glycosylhydrolase [Ancylobacter koreensis]MCK0207675.1 glycoside hydrolase family 5 protein [Ancylobacter koreensis]
MIARLAPPAALVVALLALAFAAAPPACAQTPDAAAPTSAAPTSAAPTSAAPTSASPAPGFVRAEGTRFVRPDGSTFLIKGMSFGNWLLPEGYMFKFTVQRSPQDIEDVIEYLAGPEEAARFWKDFRNAYIQEEDVAFLSAAGFTTVRVPLHWKFFLDPANPDKVDPNGEGWALIDRLVGWAKAHDIKLILDIHAAPGGQTGVNHDDGVGYPLTFYVPEFKRRTITMWRAIAERYRDETAVLGYDLLNEPITPYHDTDFLNSRLEPFYRDLVTAIREVDPNHPIMLAGAQWSTNFDVFGPPFAENLGYTYHMFWAAPQRSSIQKYVNFANRWQVPIFIGETGELNDEWNAQFRALNERLGLGWSFWTYKNLDTPSTVSSITRPAGWDAIALFGSVPKSQWPSMEKPPREEVVATLRRYIENARFANTTIRGGYIASLGLKVPCVKVAAIETPAGISATDTACP